MDIDDEPPMLIDVGDQPSALDHLSADAEDTNVKVPITIITGVLLFYPSFFLLRL